jgi:hypothetical protein
VDPAALGALQDESFARANAATRESYPPERRMTGDQLVLRGRKYAVVASTRADGRSHAALTAYIPVEGRLWLPAVAGSARAPDWASEWLVVTPTRLLSYLAEGRTI